jgi:DNA-binding transcriptional ArsR family regulator
VIEDRRLGHAAFRVYCCLRGFVNAQGVCWPRVSTIGKRLGMARPTVSEHLATLERCGHLRSEATFRNDKGRRENRYYLSSLSDQPTGGIPDQPAAPFGPADGARRVSAGTPVGLADTELDHKNITIELSPPIARDGHWFDLDEYQPSQQIIAWARETLGLDATDREILNDWKDWLRTKGEIPADMEASYRRWLRKEKRHEMSRQRKPQQKKSAAQLAMVAALDQVRASK